METIKASFTINDFPKVSDELWDEIIEAYPSGALPHIERCYYLRFDTMFGNPFVIPDFVMPITVPVGWSSAKPKDLHNLSKLGLAPLRGSRLRQFMQSRTLRKVTSCVGYVAWIPHQEFDKPWEQAGLMPDFKAGDTADQAVSLLLLFKRSA